MSWGMDRFTIAVVGGVVALVVAGLVAAAVLRGHAPQPDLGTPSGIVLAYGLAFAGLAMISTAAANLAQVLIDVLLNAPLATTDRYVRDAVSLWGATALVGLPVWLLHWLWIQRTARTDPSERASTLRRLFLYAVLGGALLVMAVSIREVFLRLMNPSTGSASVGAQIDIVVRPLPFA